jgi:hypothetical protein
MSRRPHARQWRRLDPSLPERFRRLHLGQNSDGAQATQVGLGKTVRWCTRSTRARCACTSRQSWARSAWTGLGVPDVRTWLNRLRRTCQCCAHRRDAQRPLGQQRCCAVGVCCEAYPSAHVAQVARNVLRGFLSNAQAEGLVTRNVCALVKVRLRQASRALLVGRGGTSLPRVGSPRAGTPVDFVRPGPRPRPSPWRGVGVGVGGRGF